MQALAVAALEVNALDELLREVDEEPVDLDDIVCGVELHQRRVLRVAAEGRINHLLRRRLVDRIVDGDAVPVDGGREAWDERGREYEPGRPCIGLLGLQVRVAAGVARARLGRRRTAGEHERVIDGNAASGRVVLFLQRGRTHVA